jgi:hypothetical protein
VEQAEDALLNLQFCTAASIQKQGGMAGKEMCEKVGVVSVAPNNHYSKRAVGLQYAGGAGRGSSVETAILHGCKETRQVQIGQRRDVQYIKSLAKWFTRGRAIGWLKRQRWTTAQTHGVTARMACVWVRKCEWFK